MAMCVHTNLVAANWKELAKFYIKAFGCKRKPPERKLKGEWLDSLTSIGNARIEGMHLALPGYGKDGPALRNLPVLKNEGNQSSVCKSSRLRPDHGTNPRSEAAFHRAPSEPLLRARLLCRRLFRLLLVLFPVLVPHHQAPFHVS